MRRVDRAVIVGAVVLAVDLLTKQIAFSGGADGKTHELIDGIAIDPTRNQGIAFSLLEGRTVLIFVLMAIAVTMLTAYYLRHRDRPGLWLATGLMLGGAAGNAFDRIFLGYVRDFIAVGHWPTFNVADIALTTGVVVLLVSQWQSDRGTDEQPSSEGAVEDDERADRDQGAA
jgi:signal peptidase II